MTGIRNEKLRAFANEIGPASSWSADDYFVSPGCGGRTRTSDHRINNPALYQLSYTTVSGEKGRHSR